MLESSFNKMEENFLNEFNSKYGKLSATKIQTLSLLPKIISSSLIDKEMQRINEIEQSIISYEKKVYENLKSFYLNSYKRRDIENMIIAVALGKYYLSYHKSDDKELKKYYTKYCKLVQVNFETLELIKRINKVIEESKKISVIGKVEDKGKLKGYIIFNINNGMTVVKTEKAIDMVRRNIINNATIVKSFGTEALKCNETSINDMIVIDISNYKEALNMYVDPFIVNKIIRINVVSGDIIIANKYERDTIKTHITELIGKINMTVVN